MFRNEISRRLAVAAALVAASMSSTAFSQERYPLRPIKIVVGYVAGGTNDILARIVATELSSALGQSVVVDNKPGASAIIAAQLVAKAPADGYTLMLGGTGPMAFNSALYSNLPYNPAKDFAPISLIGAFPLVLVSGPGKPSSLKDLVAFSKARPDQANYGSSSAAFQLPMELMKMRTGAKLTHIAYKGTAEVLNAVMSGQVAASLVDPGPVSSLIKAGKVTAVAVTSGTRLADFPEVPTLKEVGVDMSVSLWSALLAPAGTPEPVIRRLNEEIARIVKLPAVQERLQKLSMTPESSSPAELARLINDDIQLWTRVARENGIKAD